jgi:hypothetical protein
LIMSNTVGVLYEQELRTLHGHLGSLPCYYFFYFIFWLDTCLSSF